MAMLSTLPPAVHVSFSQPISQLVARRQQRDRQNLFTIPKIAHPASAAERWANYVLGALNSEKDLKTIGIWARQVAVSYTTLCESCRLIHVQPRQARDFVRVLRIIITPCSDFNQLAIFLDISDRRTLHAILQKAGFETAAGFPGQVSVISFLDHQQFIASQNPGLRIIREIVAPA